MFEIIISRKKAFFNLKNAPFGNKSFPKSRIFFKQIDRRQNLCYNCGINEKEIMIIMKKSYKIEVDCANCALKMENAAKKVSGVIDASISFMAQKLTVEFEDSSNPDEVIRKIFDACRKVESDCVIYF